MSVQKKAVSVSEMAKLVGLSRSRFYQLLGTAFPYPIAHLTTHRPFYPPELQEVCLEVRRTNCGVDGKLVLFHQREVEVARPERSKRRADDSRHKDLVDGLKSLGLAGVTAADVETALKELHIADAALKSDGTVLKTLFLRFKGQDTSSPTKKGDHNATQ